MGDTDRHTQAHQSLESQGHWTCESVLESSHSSYTCTDNIAPKWEMEMHGESVYW